MQVNCRVMEHLSNQMSTVKAGTITVRQEKRKELTALLIGQKLIGMGINCR